MVSLKDLVQAADDALRFPVGLRLFHYGMVVEDLGASMNLWSSVLGLSWAPPRHNLGMSVRVDRVPHVVDMSFTYSRTGPVHVELIEEHAGDVWSRLRLDHVGFYADDLPAAAAALERQGLPTVLEAYDEHCALKCTYHRTDSGLWLELLPSSFASKLAEWTGPEPSVES